jgi:hypothetical protein
MMFVINKREPLTGNEQAPIVNDLPAAARAATAAVGLSLGSASRLQSWTELLRSTVPVTLG